MEIHLDGMIPKEHMQEFLQLIRTFDQTHTDCHFEMITKDDTQTLEEARALLRAIDPPFPVERVYEKGDA